MRFDAKTVDEIGIVVKGFRRLNIFSSELVC